MKLIGAANTNGAFADKTFPTTLIKENNFAPGAAIGLPLFIPLPHPPLCLSSSPSSYGRLLLARVVIVNCFGEILKLSIGMIDAGELLTWIDAIKPRLMEDENQNFAGRQKKKIWTRKWL